MKPNRTIIVILASLLVLIGLFYIYTRANAQSARLSAQLPQNTAVVYPYYKGRVYVADSLSMRFDTGAYVSTISRDDVERLRRLGMQVEESWFPSFASTFAGESYLTWHRYKVQLPVWEDKMLADTLVWDTSVARNRRLTGTIDDVIFLPAEDGEESVMGIDIIELFVMQYNPMQGFVALRQDVPERFKFVVDLLSPTSFRSMMGVGHRYYINLSVQGDHHDYLIDTGLRQVQLKLPAEDTVRITNIAPVRRQFPSRRGVQTVAFADSVWCRLGNRAGSHNAIYGLPHQYPYLINPFKYYPNQEVVIDFPNRRLMLWQSVK